MYSLKQAAQKAGITEGLLILWISTGKFKPSVELSLKSTSCEDPVARAALASYVGPDTEAFGWNRFSFTEQDIDRLSSMVEQTVEKQKRAEVAHVKGTDYSVAELATLWGLGVDKIREMFADEPDVLKIQRPPKKGKRPYVTLKIPEAVAARVRRRNS